jgi:hypothetical protein
VLGEELAAAAVVSSGLVGGGVDENVYSVAGRADGEETEAEKTAQTVHAAVAVAASARGGDGEPHLVGGAHAVGGLQEEFEGEAEFHFDDGQGQGVAGADGDDVAAADFAFDGEAGGFQEAFDGWVEGGFGHEVEGAIRIRVGATGRCDRGRRSVVSIKSLGIYRTFRQTLEESVKKSRRLKREWVDYQPLDTLGPYVDWLAMSQTFHKRLS